MSSEATIHNLPDEMLEQILSFLSAEDCEAAFQVCRRWSKLKPSAYLSSVRLVVNFISHPDQETIYHQTLLASSRPYKHLVLYFGHDPEKYGLLVDILQHFFRRLETLELIQLDELQIGARNVKAVPVKLNVFARIVALCSTLRYLRISMPKLDFSPGELEFPPMHSLEQLSLRNNLPALVPRLKDVMPNITRLTLYIRSGQEIAFLRHFSSLLVELEVFVCSRMCFESVCDMQFPLLEKIRIRGTIKDYGSVKSLPCIENDQIRLCNTCANIQFLCISLDYIFEDCLQAICELKHLQHLRIENAEVSVPMNVYTPLKSLQILTLSWTSIDYVSGFNKFVQAAFPNLRILEMDELSNLKYALTNDIELPFEVESSICSNKTSLQRLVVTEIHSSVHVDQFLDFCASHAPPEVRLRCADIWDHSSPEDTGTALLKIPVQKLVLDVQHIEPDALRKLVASMTELRYLELKKSPQCTPDVISSLREEFPRCRVVVKRKVSLFVANNICDANSESY